MKHLVLALLAALGLPALAAAQCTPVPGTGCPGAGAITCGGQPTIGAPVRFLCPSNPNATQQLFLVGLCAPAPITGLPGVCLPTCGLGVLPPFFAVPTAGAPVVLAVPNDPNLQGAQFCVQCADVDATRGCIFLSQASSFVVQ